ncbi:hypothetical protein N7456_002560 [Penicillium angulare]|uniref:NAD-dependent epimerase/dehydratase domain-containing protein n=1 Tax=Penicillium angulare TaxID=116970 RepID=A0A9W9G8F6_9EURO|nr:hypothetical protein N7456_002560 [Penicillium angulare]
MYVFVTGGTGFVGKAVIQDLIEVGHTVLAPTRSEKGVQQLSSLGADVHFGTLEDFESLAKGAAASDGVIHGAFRNTIHDFSLAAFEESCIEERNAIEAIANALVGSNRPLVITSGTMMLPPGRLRTEDDDTPNLESPLAIARGPSDALTRSFASKGVRSSVLRIPPVNFGEGDESFIPMTIAAARKNNKSIYLGDGLNRWPATHVKDTAKAFRLALEKAPAGSTLHGVAEEGVQLKDIAEAVGKALNVSVESKGWEAVQDHFGWLANIVAVDNYISSQKTQAVLGWKPEQRSLLSHIQELST